MKNKVKQLRIEKGITQTEIADLLGVSRQTVFAIEKSMYVPSTVLALKIARLFNKKVEDIFELEKND